MNNKLTLVVTILGLILLLSACASQRKKANCSEIRYRLDHVSYDDDQRQWIEDEWSYCIAEYDSIRKVDSVKYRSIYSQFDSVQIENTQPNLSSSNPSSSSTLGAP